MALELITHALTVFVFSCFFFFQAEDGIRDLTVTGVQTCALPICIVEDLPASTYIDRFGAHDLPAHQRLIGGSCAPANEQEAALPVLEPANAERLSNDALLRLYLYAALVVEHIASQVGEVTSRVYL